MKDIILIRIKNVILHPFLLSIFPVIFIYNFNWKETSINNIFYPILFALPLTFITILILNYFFKDYKKASLFSTILLFYFYLINPISNKLSSLSKTGKIDFKHVLTILGSWLLIFLFIHLKKTKKQSDKIKFANSFLNIMMLFLLSYQFILLLFFHQVNIKPDQSFKNNILTKENFIVKKTQKLKPNIFYIIVDAYARSDNMKSLFNYNNTKFINFLKDKDFKVLENAKSNYYRTKLSIASSLNFSHLHHLVEKEYFKKESIEIFLKNNKLFDFLKKQSYKIITFHTGYQPTEIQGQGIDFKSISPFYLNNQFYTLLYYSTVIPNFKNIIFKKIQDDFVDHKNRLLYIFKTLPAISKKYQDSTFVFAHILAPHPPFFLSSKGKIKRRKRLFRLHDGSNYYRVYKKTKKRYRKEYKQQAIYITKQVKKMIKKILENSKTPPIIIIQSDHGSRSEVSFENVKKTNLKEAFGILNAYYFPYGGKEAIYNDITPVNTFRVLLNYYFKQKLKMLPDEQFYSTKQNFYVDFQKVSIPK